MANYDLGKAEGTIEIKLDDSGVEQAANSTNKIGDAAESNAKRMGSAFGLAAAGIATAIAGAAVVVAKGLYDIGDTFDAVTDTIRTGTGATGTQLDSLVNSAKNVGKTVPAEFDQVGQVVADLNTRLGLTGDDLEHVAAQVLEAGRLMGTDLDINAATGAMKAFKVSNDDVAGSLDHVFQVSQATGVGMNEILSTAQRAAPAMGELGFSFEDTVAMIGSFDKAGLDSRKVMAGMSQGLVRLAKDGEEPKAAFQRVSGEIETMLSKGDRAGALDLAGKLFGTRGAPQFIAALESGTLNVENLGTVVGQTGDTIVGVGQETQDFAEKWQLVKNNAMAAMEPLATAVFTALGDALTAIMPTLESFGNWLTNNTWVIGVVAGLIGTVLVVALGAMTAAVWASTVALLASPITWIIVGIVALIAALVLLIANWDSVVNFVQVVWGGFINWIIQVTDGFVAWWNQIWGGFGNWIGEVWGGFINWITGLWNGFVSWVMGIVNGFVGWWNGIWTTVGAFISAAWSLLVSTVQGIWSGFIAWIMGIVGALVGWWTGVWTSIRVIAAAIWAGIVAVITNYINTVRAIIVAVVTTIAAVWSSIWNAIRAVAAAIWAGITAAISNAIRTVQSIVQGTLSAISGIWSSIWGAIRAVASSIWSGITSIIGGAIRGVSSTISGTLGAIRGAWTGAWSAITSFLSSAWSNIVSAVSNGISEVLGFFTSLPGKITGALGGLAGQMLTVGTQIVQGLIDGISGMARGAIEAVTGVVDGVINAAKSLLKIKSPSRVFFDIGEFTGEGYVEGVEKMTQAAQDAMAAMLDIDAIERYANSQISGMHIPVEYEGQPSVMSSLPYNPTTGFGFDPNDFAAAGGNVNIVMNNVPMDHKGEVESALTFAIKKAQRGSSVYLDGGVTTL